MENYNCLRIADYRIKLSNMLNKEGKLYFPLHIGAFTYPDDREEKDFNLSIEQTVGLEEPKLKPIVKVDEGPTPYYIYKDDSGDYLWFIKNRQMKKAVSFYISSDWRDFKIFPENKEEGVSVFNNFGKIFAYSLLNYNSIMFHGVLLEYKEKGIDIFNVYRMKEIHYGKEEINDPLSICDLEINTKVNINGTGLSQNAL